jgi:hypothetical protein
VQIDPIKPTLKAPGTKRLKLKCDEPLSKFAFNFKSRRYSKAIVGQGQRGQSFFICEKGEYKVSARPQLARTPNPVL